MEFTIKDITETDKQIIVEVEVFDNLETFGFPLRDKKINPETNEPNWVNKIKNLVIDLYEPKPKEKKLKTFGGINFINKKLTTETVKRLDPKSIRAQKKLRDLERINNPKPFIDDSDIITELKNKQKSKIPKKEEKPSGIIKKQDKQVETNENKYTK